MSKVFRWAGRLSDGITLWPIVPSGMVGLVTYYLAKGSEWMSQFGAFGWWCAALSAFLVAAVALYMVGKVREQWALARASRKWGRDVDGINPLAAEFSKKRIRIADLAHPVRRTISNKRFVDCELVGPAVVGFIGGGTLAHPTFLDCDLIIVRPDVRSVTAFGFKDCVLVNCEISACTLFMSQEMFDESFRPTGQASLTFDRPRS